MARKDRNTLTDEMEEAQKTSTQNISIEESANDKNVGMKHPDPTTHSNIAQIPDADEAEQRKIQYEKQEKRRRLGILEKYKKEKEEYELLDTQIITQDLVDENSRSNAVERFNPSIDEGLNEDQVNQRIKEGLVNDNQKQYSKSYKQIFLNNIFTFFNILCLGVAIALIAVKQYKNLTFMAILICNTIIGIVQEIKAKKTIDKLSIVTAPTSTVIRNSLSREIQVKELVLDDLVKFKNGKQISADCIIVDGDIEVNESLLTGESIAVKKKPGDTIYAGSFVSSGSCVAKVNRVGQDCYIQKLQAKAKRYTKPKSELLRSLKLITTFIAIIIIPLGALVGWSNYTSAQTTVADPTYGTTGNFVVQVVDTNGKDYDLANDEGKLPTIEAYVNGESMTGQPVTILAKEINVSCNRVKLNYAKKANGNISVYSITVREAIQAQDGEGNLIDSYSMGNIIDSWVFDSTNADTSVNALVTRTTGGVSKYEDGTIKLDESGESITTESFDRNTQSFYIILSLQSRGRGFDATEGEKEINKDVMAITITKTAGSLIGMIPAGLFLLVTIALAVSVVKLANSKTLVQELYCIEMLARVDCICLDKTGTITDGTMKVKDIIDIAPIDPKEPSIDTIMGCMIGALEDNNLTSIALQDRFGVNFEFRKLETVPFSSSRKLSAVTFEDEGTYILGAPEFVYQGKSKKIFSIVAKKAAMGYRVLMLAKSDKPIVNGQVPTSCNPLALITLEDHIRDEAYDTIKWFKDNGVQVKVISGDNPTTVAEIAAKAGVEGASDAISLEGLSPTEVENIATEYTVFGRVSPDQKAILIRTLKKHGKTVAMTGDGVNDILAMKEADCSVAMASGSEAARSVAHLVLLDSNFANMPKVVLEGRRVINNIQMSSSLYLMKTLFVMVITVLSILGTKTFRTGYPFEPIQFMLLEFFIIGLPSTVLALQPNKDLIKGSFVRNIFFNCVSQAFCLIISVLAIYILSSKEIKGLDLSNSDMVTSMSIVALTYVGFIILTNICRPFNTLRSVLCLFVFACITTCLFTPSIAEILSINYTFLGKGATDINISTKLLLLAIILAIIPLARGFSDLIKTFQERSKKVK